MSNFILVRNISYDNYYQIMERITQTNYRSAYLHLFSKQEYQEMKCFVINESEAGLAVKKDGTIVNVFKNNRLHKNSITSLMAIGIMNGGYKLDCYGEDLVKLYWKEGFFPIAYSKFQKEKASINWNFERDGEPNIYFMVLVSKDIEKIFQWKNFSFFSYPIPEVSYEEGIEFQEYVFNRINAEEISFSFFPFYLKNNFLMNIYQHRKESQTREK